MTGWGALDLQGVVRRVTRPLVTGLWDIDLVGFERVGTDGPAILCPNHLSFVDSAFLMMTLPRSIAFVGKSEYMESWPTRVVFPALGMIPVDRSGGAACAPAFTAAIDVLRRGGMLGVFPEGTRSRSGELFRGHTGAARLAFEIGCPIFPVGITGTDRIQPVDARVPTVGGSCRIEIGSPIEPLDHSVDRGGAGDRRSLRSMTDAVMNAIAAMTGQARVDHYAGRRGPVRDGAVARFAGGSVPTPSHG